MVNRLSLQRLPRAQDRVLALAQLASLRHGQGTFSRQDVISLGEALRLPALGDVSRELTRLKASGLVMRTRAGSWALTPEGEQAVVAVAGSIEPTSANNPSEGAELGTVRHQVIPPALAPEPWLPALTRLLDRHPFERNVLLMSRFPARPDDPLTDVIDAAREVCTQHELALHLAGDQNADALLFNNVAAYMWACRFGLALFEAYGDPPSKPAALNHNLLIEVGGMLMAGRRCLILRDTSVAAMPTDLVGHIFHSADFGDATETREQLHRAFVSDFGASPCASCP